MASANPWLTKAPSAEPGAFQLVAFPHAGGDASSFYGLRDALLPSIHLRIVQLPGRGVRSSESHFEDFDSLLDALDEGIAEIRKRPFGLFGHSLGALIAYELARRWQKDGGRRARHLVVSSRTSPTYPIQVLSRDQWNDETLQNDLLGYGGTPAELLKDQDMARRIFMTFRADLSVLASYRFQSGPRLNCPILSLAGRDDPATKPEEVAGWADLTSTSFRAVSYGGGHFFLNENLGPIKQTLVHELNLGRSPGPTASGRSWPVPPIGQG
jgi:surfactin synthase thioesterase subunit